MRRPNVYQRSAPRRARRDVEREGDADHASAARADALPHLLGQAKAAGAGALAQHLGLALMEAVCILKRGSDGQSRFPDGSRGLPRVARGDPAASARMLANEIPAAIAQAEAIGVTEVASRLRAALDAARRRAIEGVDRGSEPTSSNLATDR